MESMGYKEAASFLHVSVGTLRKWVMAKKNGIPFHKVGKKVLFFREELETWVTSGKAGEGNK